MFALVARVVTSAGSVAGPSTSHFHTDIEYDSFRLSKREMQISRILCYTTRLSFS